MPTSGGARGIAKIQFFQMVVCLTVQYGAIDLLILLGILSNLFEDIRRALAASVTVADRHESNAGPYCIDLT